MVSNNPWLPFHQPNPQSGMRLFCFHHAGGSAQMYQSWKRKLPWVEVCPVQLPGRWERLRDPFFTEFPLLIEELTKTALSSTDPKPFAFFGHSLGAMIAYELTLALRKKGAQMPTRLFLSARRPVHLPAQGPHISHLPDHEFIEAVAQRYGALPQTILADPDMKAVFMKILRSDLVLYENYQYEQAPPVDVPLSVFSGAEDSIVRREELELWREYTTRGFSLRTFPGGHFYLRENEDVLIREIEQNVH